MCADAILPEYEPLLKYDVDCAELVTGWQSADMPLKDALQRMEALALEAQASGNNANYRCAELLLGVMQGYRADLDESSRHFERAQTRFEEASSHRHMIGAILHQGTQYRLQGNSSRACFLFHAAYDAAKELDYMEMLAHAACNEGLMLLSGGQLEDAQAKLEEAYAIATALPTGEQQQELFCEIHHGLASLYCRLEKFDLAWIHALDALTIAHDLEKPLLLGYANRAMAEVLSAISSRPSNAAPTRSSDPDHYFDAASSAFHEVNAEGELARTLYMQALSLADRGNRVRALRVLQQAMILFTRLSMADDAANANEAQIRLLEDVSSSVSRKQATDPKEGRAD